MAWIDLAQFAAKYGVSQSTLRRRIRANTVHYRLDRGKYFLEDSPEVLSDAPLFARNVNHPVTTAPSQRAIQGSGETLRTNFTTTTASVSAATSSTNEITRLQEENRRLNKQLGELETFVSALEAEIRRLEKLSSPRNDFGITESF